MSEDMVGHSSDRVDQQSQAGSTENFNGSVEEGKLFRPGQHDSEVPLTSLDAETTSDINRLARVLSSHTSKEGPFDGKSLNLGFDAQEILSQFVSDASDQGIHLRKTGVVLEDVGTQGVDTSLVESATFGDILRLPVTIYNGIKSQRHKKMRNILQNINLIARPGDMVLVLGRPGAGCSSLLKTAGGIIDQFSGVSGTVSYDGISQPEMIKNFKSDVIYNGELDVHFLT